MAGANPRGDRPTLSGTLVLRELSLEIAEVAEACRDLDTIVAEMLGRFPEGHRMVELQAFDLLIQRLSAASTVVARLADHMPLAHIKAADVFDQVSLSKLEARLSGDAGARSCATCGPVELW